MLRFNHMELTVPHGFLGECGKHVFGFFSQIFGFSAGEFPGLLSPYMVLRTDPEASQFLFIAEHDRPLTVGGDDHLGFLLDSAVEVDRTLAACRLWQKQDQRVEIRDFATVDYPRFVTRAYYVRYLLPIWFDIQHIAYKAAFARVNEWTYTTRN